MQATPADHPDRAGYLSNLGAALQIRFGAPGRRPTSTPPSRPASRPCKPPPPTTPTAPCTCPTSGPRCRTGSSAPGRQADLDAAIEAGQQAVQATPADHPDRAGFLSNLGNALRARFERTGARADLDAAIQAGRQAVQATPADHPDRAGYLSNLGIALRTRFERTGAAGDRDAAFQRYTEAANVDVAAASVRIGAGRAAASLVAETDPGRAASLLEAAVLLLPEVAPRFLERGDQQYAIGRFAGLAADAAALALSDPAVPEPQRPARALRLLEAARGVLLSQALSTRGDLSELRERHPELAARFIELRDWLDSPSPAAGTDLVDLPGDGVPMPCGARSGIAARRMRNSPSCWPASAAWKDSAPSRCRPPPSSWRRRPSRDPWWYSTSAPTAATRSCSPAAASPASACPAWTRPP